MERSFSLRIFGAFAGVLVLMAAAFVLSGDLYQGMTGRARLSKDGRATVQKLVFSVGPALEGGDDRELETAVRGFLAGSEALAASILDADKKEILTLRREGGKEGNGRGTTRFTLAIARPPERVIGFASVVIDDGGLRDERRNLLILNSLIGLVFLTGAALVLYPPLRRFSRSLALLNDTVRAVGSGDKIEKLPVSSDDEAGRISRSLNVMIDSLERRTREHSILEDKLRHAQKMEAVGTLARGISHDFNNILTTIKGAVHILQKKFDSEPLLQRYAMKIEKSVTEANRLIEGLITFSRTKMLQFKVVDINGLIERMKPIVVDFTEEHGVEVRTLLSREFLHVRGDSFCMEQVIWNLCLNARDAMPEGGTMTIRTDIETRRGRSEGEELADGLVQYALVAVTDTGEGIDEETQKRIFEPFFTTKETGKGTGLGLSVVHGIVEQHEGRIEMESHKGRGTTFLILLPLSDAPVARGAQNGKEAEKQ